MLVRSNPMTSFEDLFAEYLAAPEMMQAAVDRGAAAILFVSTRPRELLYRHTITWGPLAPMPMAQVAREDGLRLGRLLEAGRAVRVTLDLQNRIGGPWQAANVVAEIRGSEKPGEIVLLGAHLDSWDLGTGALDNGVNCVLVTEVARAIAAGPRPKRTIRFVLFTSEETGLLGSLGYVRTHRGELDRHVGVLIHDIGDGKVVGYFTDGRPELAGAAEGDPRPRRRLGLRHDRRHGDSGDRQLRLPPRGRTQLRRQPGDEPLPRRLPRRVRHLRQGGPRDRAPERRRRRGRHAGHWRTRRRGSGRGRAARRWRRFSSATSSTTR